MFDLSYNRTVGSDIGNEWNVNGMFKWSWGPAGTNWAARQIDAVAGGEAVSVAAPAREPLTVVRGRAPQLPEAAQIAPAQDAPTARLRQADAAAPQTSGAAADAAAPAALEAWEESAVAAALPEDAALPVYELPGATVEGKRPDWEKSLSPGQVSVVYPSAFEGEQKSLPDLLQACRGCSSSASAAAGTTPSPACAAPPGRRSTSTSTAC